MFLYMMIKINVKQSPVATTLIFSFRYDVDEVGGTDDGATSWSETSSLCRVGKERHHS